MTPPWTLGVTFSPFAAAEVTALGLLALPLTWG
jgi:hypothetical protein